MMSTHDATDNNDAERERHTSKKTEQPDHSDPTRIRMTIVSLFFISVAFVVAWQFSFHHWTSGHHRAALWWTCCAAICVAVGLAAALDSTATDSDAARQKSSSHMAPQPPIPDTSPSPTETAAKTAEALERANRLKEEEIRGRLSRQVGLARPIRVGDPIQVRVAYENIGRSDIILTTRSGVKHLNECPSGSLPFDKPPEKPQLLDVGAKGASLIIDTAPATDAIVQNIRAHKGERPFFFVNMKYATLGKSFEFEWCFYPLAVETAKFPDIDQTDPHFALRQCDEWNGAEKEVVGSAELQRPVLEFGHFEQAPIPVPNGLILGIEIAARWTNRGNRPAPESKFLTRIVRLKRDVAFSYPILNGGIVGPQRTISPGDSGGASYRLDIGDIAEISMGEDVTFIYSQTTYRDGAGNPHTGGVCGRIFPGDGMPGPMLRSVRIQLLPEHSYTT